MRQRLKLRHVLRERDVRGAGDARILSVYREYGVIPKDSRQDNFNKTPDDLSMYKKVHAGDLVINKMKAWQGSLGVSPFEGAVSGDYLVCEITSGAVDPRYLHQLLRSAPMIDQFGQRSKGIRPSQWRLYWEDLADIEIALPAQNEQRAIADYLDAETARIDALITKKTRLLVKLAERVHRVILAGVTGRLTSVNVQLQDSGIGWAGALPVHFGTPYIGAYFQTQLGKMLTSEAANDPQQYPYLKNTNVQWDKFDLTDLPTMSFDADDRRRCELRPGDLLVCEGGEVGRAAIWPGSDERIFFQKALHRVRPIREENTRYLMYCLWAAAAQGAFAAEGNQSTIVHLTGEKLREHRIPWPPSAEQVQIVKIIDEARLQAATLETSVRRQIDLLREHRRALITAAVTGELRIPGAA